MLPGRRDALGRLDVTTDPVAASSVLQGGIAVNPLGQVHITNVIPGLGGASFHAPLKTSLLLDRGVGDPTFTRATTAYVEDFEGVWREVPSGAARFKGARMVRNFVSYSEDATQWTIAAEGITVTSDAGSVSYDGQSIDLDFLEETATTNMHRRGILIAASITNRRGSFFAKANGRTRCRVWSWAGGDTGTAFFDLSTGVASGALNPSMELIEDGVYRCSYDVDYRHTQAVVGPMDAVVTEQNPYLGEVGKGILVGGWQIEELSTGASEYVSNGVLSAPYHGAGVNGIKYFATELDGTPIAAKSRYLREFARTNALLYCRDLANPAWVKTNCTAALNAVGIDGAVAASTLTATGANATCLQALTLAAAARAYGVFLKRKTGVGTVEITRDNGVTWVDVTSQISTAKFTRVKIENSSVLNPTCGIRLGTSGDEVYVDFNQDENASNATSPILTTAAAATRNEDVLTYDEGNFSQVAGSCFAEIVWDGIDYSQPSDIISVSRSPLYIQASAALSSYDGTTAAEFSVGNIEVNVEQRCGSTWKTGGNKVVYEGGNKGQIVAAYDGSFESLGSLVIGSRVFCGEIGDVVLWPEQLSDEEMIDMTSPSGQLPLEPTEVNFINGFMVSNTGQLVMSSDPIASYQEGLPRDALGRLKGQTDTVPAATDPYVGGIRVGPLGGVYTTLVAPPVGDPPVNVVPPDITGDARVGATLTCDDGTWEGTAPITYTYQWYQGINVIIGATTNSYVVQAQDLGAVLLCAVTATNAVGAASKVSEPGVRIVSARYDYKNIASTPASGQVVSGSASAPLQVRINAIDKDGLNHAGPLSRLQIGDSIFVGTQEGILTAEPIELNGYFILETAAWPLLADGEYDVTLGFN